jgi:lantibiotic modifying enzyme
MSVGTKAIHAQPRARHALTQRASKNSHTRGFLVETAARGIPALVHADVDARLVYMRTHQSREVHPWRPLLHFERSEAALKIALDVAGRLREPAQVEAAVVEAKLQSNLPKGGPNWAPYGLAQGYSGLALLFGQLDRCFPGEGWDSIAHEHLELAAHGAATQAYLMPSVFSGFGGLAFVAWYLSRSGTRYQHLVSTLEKSLIRKLKPMIADLSNQHDGVPVNAFDMISGLSGVCVYLVSRLKSGETESALRDLVRCLIELSCEENGLPRWYSPPHLSSSDDFMLQQFPNGYLNCGLAHGIPGPLGALSLARLAGLNYEGLEEAIDCLAAWLTTHRLDDEWGINWPTGVGLLPPGDPAGRVAPVNASPQGQAGWCYGSPGIARALYFAGLALRKPEYCDLAVGAIEAVLERPVAARRIESPTFCHGVAGLLEIVLRFANDTGAETMRTGAKVLTEQLINLYEPESLLGFRSIEFQGKRVDQPGLLDGAPGVALVLLAVACDVEPDWDRIFLLS